MTLSKYIFKENILGDDLMSVKLYVFSILGILLFVFVLLSGCVAPGTDESNLGTVQSGLTSSSGNPKLWGPK